MTRNEMAWVYAGIISTDGEYKDYPTEKLNCKIIERWSKSGLEYIKGKAWKNIAILHKEFKEV